MSTSRIRTGNLEKSRENPEELGGSSGEARDGGEVAVSGGPGLKLPLAPPTPGSDRKLSLRTRARGRAGRAGPRIDGH